MGIIQKQAIKGTVYSYIGVVIGFFTTAILFPRILTTGEIGLLKLLVSFSVLFAQFGSLGFTSVINRLFPYFRKSGEKHNGFIILAILISFTGFLLTSIAFEIYKPFLIRNNLEDSALLVEYAHLIIPLIFATLFFDLFDSYNKVLYDAVLGTFLKEFLQRMLILVSIFLYYLEMVTIHQFIYAYTLSLMIPTLVLLGILITRKEMTFRLNRSAFGKPVLREMGIISFFGFISGIGGLAIAHIDSLLVNKFLGISLTGIYATTFFFGTLVLIPSRPLIKISTAIVADAWKSGNIDNIRLVYSKSCINQAMIGLLIFAGLWVNIENIFQILPEEFEAGKYVIFFIGLANVIEMTAGVSGTIIGTSEYYRLNAVFIIIFLIFLVGLNFIFIPMWGLPGAALASACSRLIYVLIRYLFLRIKFHMDPYNSKYLILIAVTILSYLAGFILPVLSNYIIDILVRSSIVLLVFSILVIVFPISGDVHSLYLKAVKKILG